MWVFILVLCLWSADPALAEVYLCAQPDGSTLFTDQPGPGCKPKSAETTPNRRPLYWCDGRVTFGDIRDAPLREECERLRPIPKPESDKQSPEALRKKNKTVPSVTLDPHRKNVDDFLARYREFLKCCVQDPDAYIEAENLEAEASAFLQAMETNLSFNQLMTVSGRGVIIEVANARDKLRAIIQTNKKLEQAYERKSDADFEGGGREQHNIHDLEGALKKLSQPPPTLERAKTGDAIGITPVTGQAIGTEGRSGDQIGSTPTRGMEIGQTPPTGEQIGQQPPRGPNIGYTPPTGAAIGNSSFNKTP